MESSEENFGQFPEDYFAESPVEYFVASPEEYFVDFPEEWIVGAPKKSHADSPEAPLHACPQESRVEFPEVIDLHEQRHPWYESDLGLPVESLIAFSKAPILEDVLKVALLCWILPCALE